MKWKDYNICMVRLDIADFVNTLPKNVTLVAATKYLTADEMLPFLDAGVNNFGENRVESFLEKYESFHDFILFILPF